LRQIVQDDHDCRRHEDAQQKSVNDVQDQQQLVVTNEWNGHRRGDVKKARPDQHAAQAEHRGKPGDGGGDEDLWRGRSGRQPCPLIDAQAERASQVRQAQREQPNVETRDEGAEQHGADGQPRAVGLGGVAAAADGCRRHNASLAIWMRVTTDIPGRSCAIKGCPGSNSIRTGTRCTTLVKLPVALSGGSKANVDPLAGETRSTWPRRVTSGNVSTVTATGWPGATCVSWVSL